jgi:hypothetical protein
MTQRPTAGWLTEGSVNLDASFSKSVAFTQSNLMVKPWLMAQMRPILDSPLVFVAQGLDKPSVS